MWSRVGVIAASQVLVGSLVPGVAGAAEPVGESGAVVSVAESPVPESSPQPKGWVEVSRGVFVFDRLGDPSLIERAGKARPGRNLTLRVSEDVRAYRVLANGDVNHLDNAEDGRVRIPGDRVHSRGALMFMMSVEDARAPRAVVSAARDNSDSVLWMYVDTNASVNDRGRLVGASGLVSDKTYIELSIHNETNQTFGLQLKDFQGSLTPGATVTKEDHDNTLWNDDVKGQLTLPDGTGIYIGARHPSVGRDSITVGDIKHQFGDTLFSDGANPCYFTATGSSGQPTYLIGRMTRLATLTSDGSVVYMALTIVPTEPTDGTVPCSSNF